MLLYNTLARKKQEFKPLGEVAGFYSCGPTVYWYQHIGNLRTYIFNDILKRTLRYAGYSVRHVMNYTDVGHLTSDADEGEDKMEKAAKREGKSAREIASHYTEAFERDAAKLNIIPPDVTCNATDYIKEQIELICLLEKKSYTYRTGDGIYFDTSKVKDYGRLGRIKAEELKAGKRTDMRQKRNKTDFALWKFSEMPGARQQEWESPWGIGFPGWHTECCVMSSRHLGRQFDIHTGGEDHIQIHHTNEIAQMEAAYGVKPWVRFWLHGGFLTFRGEKVSKSKGGLYTVSELETMGFVPVDYRYLCLNTHYRKQLAFSVEAMEQAKSAHARLRQHILDLRAHDRGGAEGKGYVQEFASCVNDDLNMPRALSVLWQMLRDDSLSSRKQLEMALDFDRVLGLGLEDVREDEAGPEVMHLVRQREDARKKKDYAEADRLRQVIQGLGYAVSDTPEGPRLRKL